MTCVQQRFPTFPSAGFAPSGFSITAGKTFEDWRTTSQEDAATEDIRFTFSIWHVPTIDKEPVQRKNDTSLRARTPSRHARTTAPFSWLPLLPLEEPAVLPSATVVETGISLSVPEVEEDQHAFIPALIRRVPVSDVAVDAEEALPAKKKRRLSLRLGEPECIRAAAQDKDAEQVISAQKGGLPLGTVIRKVRMRDVDVVEEFLVSHVSCNVVTRTYFPPKDQFLPEFGTGVPLRILLGASGVTALAVQDGSPLDNATTPTQQRQASDVLDPSLPILALVVYRTSRSDSDFVTTHVQAIAVRPTSRRRGLGQRLVAEALRDSREDARRPVILGPPQIRLKAEGYEDNGSREFWQRCVAGLQSCLQVSSRRIGCRRGWVGEARL